MIEPRLRAGLERVRDKHEIVGDVRGTGAFFALEFVSDREARDAAGAVARDVARADAGAVRRA